MSTEIEIEKQKIVSKRKRKKNRGRNCLFIAVILLSIFLYDKYVNIVIKSSFLLELCLLSAILLTVSGLIFYFSPLSNYEIAFLYIVEIIDNFSVTHFDEELREEAYKKMISVSDRLTNNTSLTSDASSWYLKDAEVETQFIENLRNRLAPAIREGRVLQSFILDNAFVFTKSGGFKQMKLMNDKMEKQLDEVLYKETRFYSLALKSFSYVFKRTELSIIFVILIVVIVGLISAALFGEPPLLFFKQNWGYLLTFCGAIIAAIIVKTRD